MTQEEWQALLPFYVSGQLSAAERAIVEQALRESEACRRALAEWEKIATAVTSRSSEWASNPPPLSASVRQYARTPITQPNRVVVTEAEPAMPTVPIPVVRVRPDPVTDREEGWKIPITMVASILVVFVIGGLLIALLQAGGGDEQQFGTSASATESGHSVTATLESELGILATIQPTVTPTQVWATNTTIPSIEPTPTPLDGCFVSSATSQPVRIYDAPDATASIVSSLQVGSSRAVSVYNPSGWYELINPEGGISGWVQTIEVNLLGSCQDIPVATPVLATPNTLAECVISLLDSRAVNLYIEPNRDSSVVKVIEDLATVYILDRYIDGQWYRTRYDELGVIWVGWIHVEDALFSRECQSLDTVELDITPFLTPVIGESTPVPVPLVESFEVADESLAQAGSAVRLEWQVRNAAEVSIAFYHVDVPESDYGQVEPLASFGNMLSQGNLDVLIPTNYAYAEAVFVLAVRPFGSDGLTPIDALRVAVQPSQAN